MTDTYDLTGRWLARSGSSSRERELAVMLDGALGRPSRVLELGAGFGGFALAIARMGHRVIAVERSTVRAQYASGQIAEARPGVSDRIEVVSADFLDIRISGPFDTVVCWNGFGCGPDVFDLPLLQRIGEWLSPGCWGYLDVFDPQWWEGACSFAVNSLGLRKFVRYHPESHQIRIDYWKRGEPAHRATETVRCQSRQQARELAERAELDVCLGRTDQGRGTYLLGVRRPIESTSG